MTVFLNSSGDHVVALPLGLSPEAPKLETVGRGKVEIGQAEVRLTGRKNYASKKCTKRRFVRVPNMSFGSLVFPR